MRQIQKLPIFTAAMHRLRVFTGLVVVFAVVMIGCSGCTKKTTVKVPEAILQAKTATLEEILAIVNQYDSIHSLQVSKLKAEYTSKKKTDSLIELQKRPKVPGLLLMKRPDSLFLVLKDPAFNTTLLNLSSVGEEFKAWFPKKNTFYIGDNSAETLVSDELEEPLEIPVRAPHIFSAIFPKAVDPEDRIALLEDQDANAKYYVVTVYRESPSRRLYPLREFRIERAGLTLSRQRIFDHDGRITGNISYLEMSRIEKYALPRKILIERPLDGYTLVLEFRNLKINPDFRDDTFDLELPESGAKVIRFK